MTKKPVLAVDIDEVLADHATDFLKFSNTLYGTNLKVDDYTEHWAELFQIDNKEVERLAKLAYSGDLLKNLKHREDSVKVLQKLKKKFKLIVVTARMTMLREDTVAWIEERYKGIFDEIHFADIWNDGVKESSHLSTKKDHLVSLGVNYLIDDQPKHCIASAKAGIKVVLFGDYGWNKDYEKHKNITKLHTWEEVGRFLWDSA